MAWLLMMLVGCGGVGNDTTVYDACITARALLCECGDTTNGGGSTGYCDDAENDAACAAYQDDVGDDGNLIVWQNCFNESYAKDCKKKAAEAACQEEYDTYLAER